MLVFANRSSDYYERLGDDSAVQYYGAVASVSATQLATLELPGSMRARDERYRLYIRLSNVPDEREIGVFEVRVD